MLSSSFASSKIFVSPEGASSLDGMAGNFLRPRLRPAGTRCVADFCLYFRFELSWLRRLNDRDLSSSDGATSSSLTGPDFRRPEATFERNFGLFS